MLVVRITGDRLSTRAARVPKGSKTSAGSKRSRPPQIAESVNHKTEGSGDRSDMDMTRVPMEGGVQRNNEGWLKMVEGHDTPCFNACF